MSSSRASKSKMTRNDLKEFRVEEIRRMTNFASPDAGEGSCSQVFIGEMHGQQVAVKRTSFRSGEGRSSWEKEKEMFKIFSGHPSIVKCYGYAINEKSREGYFVMEYLPTSLDDVVDCSSDIEFKWEDYIDILIQIAEGLKCIHEKKSDNLKKYVFVDLKPANVMLSYIDGQGVVAKIIDLGSIGFERSAGYHYSDDYAAPETLSGTTSRTGGVDAKSDVYVFGLIIKDLLGRDKKSRKKEEREDQQKKDKGRANEMSKYGKAGSSKNLDMVGRVFKQCGASDVALEGICALVMRCTHRRKDQRPGMDGVLDELRRIRELKVKKRK